MNIWADVYDITGATLQGEGPITNIQRASITRALDGAGEISLSAFATDPRVQDLIANERRVVLYTGTSVTSKTITIAAPTGPGTDSIGYVNGAGHVWLAQKFVPEDDMVLTSLDVTLGASVGSPSGDITWEVRTDNSNKPSATILFTGDFTPVDSSTNTTAITGASTLSANTTYWLLLRPTTPQATGADHYWGMNVYTSSQYASGSYSYTLNGGTSWTNLATYDMTLAMTGTVKPKRELGRGVIRKINGVETTDGLPITLSGPDQLIELGYKNCGIGRVYNGTTVANTVAALIALPSGWSATTTGTSGNVYARFDGTSVLKALQEVAKFKNYHFHLSGNKAITFGALGTDSGLRIIQAGSHVTPEMEANEDILLIDRLTWLHDSEAVANYIIPTGNCQDEDILTLASSTKGGLTSAIKYDASNRDTAFYLNGPTGAGGTTTITGTSGGYILGNSGSTVTYALAQSFQVTAGILSQFTATFGANSTPAPSGFVHWEIRENEYSAPGGAVLASGDFIPTASAVNTITVPNGPFLNASTTYWLTMAPKESQATSVYWLWNYGTPSTYANGNMASAPIGSDEYWQWTADTAKDLTSAFTTTAITTKSLLAQSFVAGGEEVPKIDLWLSKVGSPTGNLTLTIRADSGGDPGSSAIANGTSGTVAASILSTTADRVTFVFATPPTLTATNTYWLVLATSDSQSNVNYVQWAADYTPSFADGELKHYAAAWAAETPSKDFCFDIFERSAHSDAYTLNVVAGPDGRAMHYLSDATSIAAYGQIERVFTSSIIAASDSETDITNAANALYDAATTWLGRYGTRQTVYSCTVRKAVSNLLPGQKVRLVYKGFIYDQDGNLITWLDVDSLFWVTRVTETVSQDGLSTSIEISNLERAYEDASALIVGTMESVALSSVTPQTYTYRLV